MSVHYAHHNAAGNGVVSFAPRDKGPISDAISALLDTAIAKKAAADYEAGRGSGQGDVAKKRIGAGYIGTECGRALAYRYHRAEKRERESKISKGELQRHAEAGHWTEAMTAGWLRLAGFHVLTEREDGSQYGWKAAWDRETGQARMAGEVDGVILAVPPGIKLATPAIWESKKATDKKWSKFSKDGVAVADPKYYGQLQANMAHMEIGQTLFSMLNLDNMKFYFEVVTFDAEAAQRLIDRGVQVMQSSDPEEMPRIARSEDDWRCKFCDYHHLCWAKRQTASEALAKPAWLGAVA